MASKRTRPHLNTPEARAANARRARCEVAGPALRRAIEPVRLCIAVNGVEMMSAAGLHLTREMCEAILAACRAADGE